MIGEAGPHNGFNSEMKEHWERGNEWCGSMHSRSFHLFWARNQKSGFLVLALLQLDGWDWVSDLFSLGLSVLSIHRGVIVSHLCEHWGESPGRNSEVWQWCSYEANTHPVHLLLIQVSSSYSPPLLLFWWRWGIFSKSPREIALSCSFSSWSLMRIYGSVLWVAF